MTYSLDANVKEGKTDQFTVYKLEALIQMRQPLKFYTQLGCYIRMHTLNIGCNRFSCFHNQSRCCGSWSLRVELVVRQASLKYTQKGPLNVLLNPLNAASAEL
jgi:hypothetical protein